MKIKSSFKTYEVCFENQIDFLKEYYSDSNVFWVIDHNVYSLYKELWGEIDPKHIYVLEVCEENKNVHTALDICEIMTQMPSKRNTQLVSVGGGITQDITGFIANILYRGIGWVFLPTTLLAAADSCIGGKTSLNYKSFKNLLGTFFPPDKIYIYPTFFKTLSQVDIFCGLGEIAKFNVMTGEEGIAKLERDIELLIDGDFEALKTYMINGLNYKRRFIEVDEFDKGERILLNFAHTFGHAIETVSSYHVPHGQAVAIGMLVANHISVQRGLMADDKSKRIEAIVKRIINIPLKEDYFCVEQWVRAIKNDKKQTSETLSAILMTDSFELVRVNDIGIDEIRSATAYIKQLFSIS